MDEEADSFSKLTCYLIVPCLVGKGRCLVHRCVSPYCRVTPLLWFIPSPLQFRVTVEPYIVPLSFPSLIEAFSLTNYAATYLRYPSRHVRHVVTKGRRSPPRGTPIRVSPRGVQKSVRPSPQ